MPDKLYQNDIVQIDGGEYDKFYGKVLCAQPATMGKETGKYPILVIHGYDRFGYPEYNLNYFDQSQLKKQDENLIRAAKH